MSVYTGKHPVFVSHAKELEQMAYFTADLQYRTESKGIYSGVKYDCLVKVRRKCADLLLRMYSPGTFNMANNLFQGGNRKNIHSFDTGCFPSIFKRKNNIPDTAFLGADNHRKGSVNWANMAVKT